MTDLISNPLLVGAFSFLLGGLAMLVGLVGFYVYGEWRSRRWRW